MRAGMPADQGEVRRCLTVFAADEAPWGDEGGIGWDFPHVGLDQ